MHKPPIYYSRFCAQWRRDVFQLGKSQVVGLLLAVAILVLQIRFGIVPEKLTLQAWLSVLWPYAALVVLFSVWTLIYTPVKMDRRRAVRIDQLRESNKHWRMRAEQQLAPPLTQEQEDRRVLLRGGLEGFSNDGKKFLKWLALHGWVETNKLISSGIEQRTIEEAMGIARRIA